MDWSVLKQPDTWKLGAEALSLGAGIIAIIDKILSRKKPPAATQTFNFFFGGATPTLQPPLLKKT
jgi:hypothetical protein